jgi:methylthioribose-1-phosphate isomerase
VPTGEAIPIEERDIEEVTHIGGQRIMPEGVVVANPAFDVTPHQLIKRIISERAVLQAPYDKGIATLFAQATVR